MPGDSSKRGEIHKRKKAEISPSLTRLRTAGDLSVDSLKVLFEPFEDRFHSFFCPLPIHVEVYAVF
jgi:hypothetical protein